MASILLALILLVNAHTNHTYTDDCAAVRAQAEALEVRFDVDFLVYEDCSIELVS